MIDYTLPIPCPKCGGRVIYNGNYFCSITRLERSDCGWVLKDSDGDLLYANLVEAEYQRRREPIPKATRDWIAKIRSESHEG